MTNRSLVGILTAALAVALFSFGCVTVEEPAEREPAPVTEAESQEPAVSVPAHPKAEEVKRDPAPAEANPRTNARVSEEKTYLTGHRWAPGKGGVLLKGLDGGLYQPYSFGLVKEVQQKLAEKGLYSGEVNGYMDEQTMEALGVFQRESNLAVSGVPTPRTRELLLAAAVKST